VERMRPMCECIEIAGSIRRQSQEVKDIEIVYVSRMAPVPGQLFDVHSYPLTEDLIREMVEEGVLAYDEEIHRNGPKYKRMVHPSSGVIVELFRAEVANWGVILALRTGPAKFSQMLVSHGWEFGVLPVDYEIRDGYLWRRGVVFPTPDEATLFAQLDIPHYRPEQRHPGRLAMYERSRSAVQPFE
jgi:DNA polymerase/3'-5' exonuclease PolX